MAEVYQAAQEVIQPNEPLSYLELEAWARLTGRALNIWEARTLISLDNFIRTEYGRHHQPPNSG